MSHGRFLGRFSNPLLRAGLAAAAVLAILAMLCPANAQTSFDRPGGDYVRLPVESGDPADCALICERDRRCRAWSFSYPQDPKDGAVCWLKNSVPPRVANSCCVSGIRGAGVIEPRNSGVETFIDRFGGDYRSFEIKSGDDDDACKAACVGEARCRAWTYARPGYVGRDARCFLKKEIKPPRRKPGFISGVVR